MYCENNKNIKRKIRLPVFIFLLVAGSLQMIGDLGHIKEVKAFALALQVSPAPKVFTAQEGFETYSSQFFLEWKDKTGGAHTMRITPKEYYNGVKGPYNRRNAYGAALSYGPVLNANAQTKPMFESISRYALCGDAPILSELGIDRENIDGNVTVRLKPRQKLETNHKWKLEYEISCL